MVIDVFQGAAQAAAASRAARTAAPHTAVKMIKWTQNIESPALQRVAAVQLQRVGSRGDNLNL